MPYNAEGRLSHVSQFLAVFSSTPQNSGYACVLKSELNHTSGFQIETLNVISGFRPFLLCLCLCNCMCAFVYMSESVCACVRAHACKHWLHFQTIMAYFLDHETVTNAPFRDNRKKRTFHFKYFTLYRIKFQFRMQSLLLLWEIIISITINPHRKTCPSLPYSLIKPVLLLSGIIILNCLHI